MQKLHCTWTELQDQPVAEMEVFKAFMLGESDYEKQVAQANANKEQVRVVG